MSVADLYRNRGVNPLAVSTEPARDLLHYSLFNDANLVAYYRLEDNANDSKNANHGTATSVTYLAADGKFGLGGNFVAATPSRISLPVATEQPGSFTFSLWMNPRTIANTNGEANILAEWSSGHRNYLCEQVNATLLMLNGNGSTSQDASISGGTLLAKVWQYVTFVRNGTTTKIYLNAVEVATRVNTYSGGAIDQAHYLGADATAAANYGFDGSMDEVAIFSRALTVDEIRGYYNWSK
jgi:hypothetical protein